MLLFWITIIIFMVVIVMGNYLYFNRVLPTIDEAAEIMPSKQSRQIKSYLGSLNEEKSKGLAYAFLKYNQHIQSLMGLLLICNIIYMSVIE